MGHLTFIVLMLASLQMSAAATDALTRPLCHQFAANDHLPDREGALPPARPKGSSGLHGTAETATDRPEFVLSWCDRTVTVIGQTGQALVFPRSVERNCPDTGVPTLCPPVEGVLDLYRYAAQHSLLFLISGSVGTDHQHLTVIDTTGRRIPSYFTVPLGEVGFIGMDRMVVATQGSPITETHASVRVIDLTESGFGRTIFEQELHPYLTIVLATGRDEATLRLREPCIFERVEPCGFNTGDAVFRLPIATNGSVRLEPVN